MTGLATVVRIPQTVNRRLVAAVSFAVLGLVDILVLGHFSHAGDATFALSLPGASVTVSSLHVPARVGDRRGVTRTGGPARGD
jgi:hypothetical protein